jgi:hypothetical protein
VISGAAAGSTVSGAGRGDEIQDRAHEDQQRTQRRPRETILDVHDISLVRGLIEIT